MLLCGCASLRLIILLVIILKSPVVILETSIEKITCFYIKNCLLELSVAFAGSARLSSLFPFMLRPFDGSRVTALLSTNCLLTKS